MIAGLCSYGRCPDREDTMVEMKKMSTKILLHRLLTRFQHETVDCTEKHGGTTCIKGYMIYRISIKHDHKT